MAAQHLSEGHFLLLNVERRDHESLRACQPKDILAHTLATALTLI